MDITFQTEAGVFNYRVCAVILDKGRLLAMWDERSPYAYLPGGRVKFRETAEDALKRELREELEIDAEIARPLWLNQGFFTEDVSQKQYHELCLYFLVDIAKTSLLERGERFSMSERGRAHRFEWMPLDTLKPRYLYPVFIKEGVFHLPDRLTIRTEWE